MTSAVMPRTRPRLILLPGACTVDDRLLASLREDFEVVEAENAGSLPEMIDREDRPLVLLSREDLTALSGSALPDLSAVVLEHVGEGAAVIQTDGALVWRNARFAGYPPLVGERVIELGEAACQEFNRRCRAGADPELLGSLQYAFSSNDEYYELVVSPAAIESGGDPAVKSVVCVLWDVTESRRLEAQIEAIDTAGAELMRIEASAIKELNMADRLKLLEEKIARYVHDLLHFDNFEIRLLDQETSQLELVIAVGLTPLKIGEVIYASEHDNGISGYVAATGKSYVCSDVRQDPLYREGLDNAASSLTVPLMLHDHLIGVFNVESYTAGAFDDNDRRFAEIFARYIAMAINILDLLVVERYTTNEQVASNVLGELHTPLEEIRSIAEELRRSHGSDEVARESLDRILNSTEGLRRRIESCTAGPRTVLGAEEAMAAYDADPTLVGKRVLVADNETAIRETVGQLLTQKGCETILCADGGEAIRAINQNEPGQGFDLVVSDIKMPDYNGYEVFHAARDQNEHIKVILMTGFGYDPHHSIVRASQEGLNAFLFKPFKADQLIEAVEKALAPLATEGTPRKKTGRKKSSRR